MLRRHFIENSDSNRIIKITYTADSQQFFCTEDNEIKEGDVLYNALNITNSTLANDDLNEYIFLKEDYDTNSKIGNWYFKCETSPNTIATGFRSQNDEYNFSTFLCSYDDGTPHEFTQLEISEGVEEIKVGYGFPGAFGVTNDYLNTIILPQSLKYIDDSAFLGFNSIVNIIGGDNLEYITNIQINNTMYQVFGMSFAESLYMQTEQYSKGKVLFKVKIEPNVKVPEGFNQYYPTLFLGGEEIIESIELPDNFTEIYPGMCGYMLNLNTINLSNVTSIGEQAFAECTNLKYVDLSNVTSIGEQAFAESGIEEFTINEKILSDDIGDDIFRNCKNLKTAILPINYTPAGTANINNLMYRGCTNIETVYFNSKTCSGTNELFSESSDTIKSVIFGEFVTKICRNAFRNSPLENIIYKGTIEQWNSIYKGTNWCEDAVTTVVHCTDGDIELERI